MPRSLAALSVLLHAALLAGLLAVVVPRPAPPLETSFGLQFEPSPVETQALQPVGVSAPAIQLPAPLAMALPVTVKPFLPVEAAPARRSTSKPDAVAPGQKFFPGPVSVPPMSGATRPSPPHPPAAAQAGPPAGALAALEAKIQSAVQAALIYPQVARLRREQGRVRVRFDYQNGAVDEVSVATPSGAPLLDQSALATLRRAPMPQAPADIGGRRLTLLVWVDYSLMGTD